MKSIDGTITQLDYVELEDLRQRLKYEQYAFGLDHSVELARIADLIGEDEPDIPEELARQYLK